MKKYIKEFLFSFILLVIFNVLAFVIPFTHSKNFWISYAFGMIAIILFVGSCFACISTSGELRSKFYSWPIIRVTFIYGVIQVILSLLVMLLPAVPSWIIIVVYVLLLCIALLGLIAADAEKDIVESIDKKVQAKVFYIRSLVADVEGMIDNADDAQLRKKLKELAETVQYSDPMSNEQLYPLESKISARCAELGELVENHDNENASMLCDSIIKLLTERNRKCALLK